jgi:hypothetical protein
VKRYRGSKQHGCEAEYHKLPQGQSKGMVAIVLMMLVVVIRKNQHWRKVVTAAHDEL